MSSVHVQVSATGRMSLPEDIRKSLGVQNGGHLILEVDGDGVRLRTDAAVVSEAPATLDTPVQRARTAVRDMEARAGVKFSVDDVLADRPAIWND